MAINRSVLGSTSSPVVSGARSTPLITTSASSPQCSNCSGKASRPINLAWCPNGVQPGNNRPRPLWSAFGKGIGWWFALPPGWRIAESADGEDMAGPRIHTIRNAHASPHAHVSSAHLALALEKRLSVLETNDSSGDRLLLILCWESE